MVNNENLHICVIFVVNKFSAGDELLILLLIFVVNEKHLMICVIFVVDDKYLCSHFTPPSSMIVKRVSLIL